MNIAQQSKVIKNTVGLLRLAEQLDSVSKACKVTSTTTARYKNPAHVGT